MHVALLAVDPSCYRSASRRAWPRQAVPPRSGLPPASLRRTSIGKRYSRQTLVCIAVSIHSATTAHPHKLTVGQPPASPGLHQNAYSRVPPRTGLDACTRPRRAGAHPPAPRHVNLPARARQLEARAPARLRTIRWRPVPRRRGEGGGFGERFRRTVRLSQAWSAGGVRSVVAALRETRVVAARGGGREASGSLRVLGAKAGGRRTG